MNTLSGQASGLERAIIARVTRESAWRRKGDLALITDAGASPRRGYAVVLSSGSREASPARVAQVSQLPSEELERLSPGDVVAVEPSGLVTRVWTAGSRHNVLMVTNRCNCRCIMCPQPPARDPAGHEEDNRRILRLAAGDAVPEVAFTGGEPTTRPDHLCELIELASRHLPQTRAVVLTNGRTLSDFSVAKRIALLGHPDLLFEVSIQADIPRLHDHIMGSEGTFVEAVRGLHNLARLRQRSAVRVVMQKQNTERLPGLAEFIYRNLPFVSHVAWMGLEIIGAARENLEEVWAEAPVLNPALLRAVRHLHRRGIPTSIYNMPLCLLPKELWPFARDSISDWKKNYLEDCIECSVRETCCGVFGTSSKQLAGTTPITSC